LNPERTSCGFKNIWIRVDGALVSMALEAALLGEWSIKIFIFILDVRKYEKIYF